MNCEQCKPLREPVYTDDGEYVTEAYIAVELCKVHSLAERLAEVLKVYAEKTTLHSIRGGGYAVFNSPGPELAKETLVEYDSAKGKAGQ